MNKTVLGFLMIGLTHLLQAQVNRYMVFFTDKDQSPYSINEPEAFLTPNAIERRQKGNIEIDITDVPVNPQYLSGVQEAGATPFFTTKWMNGVLVQVDQSDLESILDLSYVANVEYVAPGAKLMASPVGYEIPESFKTPGGEQNDSASYNQLEMLNAHEMHRDGIRGHGIAIAVLDGGFRGANEYRPMRDIYIDDRLMGARDFVENSGDPFQYSGHGTRVFSLIGGDYPGFRGVAYKAKFVLCVTEDVDGEYRIEEYNWLFGAEYADSLGVDIIHSSLGYSIFSDPSMNYGYADMDGQTTIVTQAANMAHEKGILVVTSAGNEGDSNWKYITAPADAPEVLTVGSVNKNGVYSNFSSVGPTSDGRIKPEVVAMGSGTYSMRFDGVISQAGGTSYAAPLIAGFAAGIWQAKPDWSHQQVIDSIRMAGSQSLSPDSLLGYGIPDYETVYKDQVLSLPDILEDKITVYPNPFRDNWIYIATGNRDIYPLNLQIWDARGASILEQEITQPPFDDVIRIEINVDQIGIYLLQISSDSFSKQVKLVKK